MRLLHISDLHLLRTDDLDIPGEFGLVSPASLAPSTYAQILQRMGSTMPHLRQVVAEACRSGKIDAIAFTGDLAENGDVDTYVEIGKALDRALDDAGCPDIPVVATPGNHDDRRSFARVFAPDEDPDLPLVFARRVQGVLLVSFDSSDPSEPDGKVDEGALERLESLLERTRRAGETAIVMTHHHLVDCLPGMPPCKRGSELLALLRQQGICAVLTGHTHHATYGCAGGIPYYVAPSLSFTADAIACSEAPDLFGEYADVASRAVRFKLGWGYSVHEVESGRIVRSGSMVYDPGVPLGDLVARGGR